MSGLERAERPHFDGPFPGRSRALVRASDQAFSLYADRMVEPNDEARREEVLVKAALALTSELSLPAVLQKIADLACEVADARYAALGVVGSGGRIVEFVTHGLSDEQRARIGRLPEGHGILGALIKDARPLRLPRIQDDPRSIGFPANHPPMTTFLGVPVAIHGKVFGNLYLTEKRDGAHFTQGDEDAVVRLAAQAAVAVENARLYHEAQVGQRLLTAVNLVANAILEGQDIDEVLGLVARHARELVNARVATVTTPFSERDLILRVADGENAASLAGTRFPASGSISGEIMGSGEPVVVPDLSSDERSSGPLAQLGTIKGALFVPLAVRGRSFGTLGVGNHEDDDPFSEEDLEMVRTFAAQAAIALEHQRITDELQRLALVEDRERIAKELHDDVIQSLFAEGMALQASLGRVNDSSAMEVRISQAVENIDRVIRDLRNYIFGLRPGAAADRQVERSLNDLALSFERADGATIEVVIDPTAASQVAGRAADVVQLAREAISNAVRHSGCDLVRVTLSSDGENVALEVSDDGKGFVYPPPADHGHGLRNLRERAAALGGELSIESETGTGTLVRVTIPL